GDSAQAAGFYGVAVGVNSRSTGSSAVALGEAAKATKKNSVALGNNSVANAANVISVGSVGHERRIINVANAVNATDAVNLGQVTAMLKANTRLRAVVQVKPYRLARLGDSDAMPALPPRTERMAHPVMAVNCELGASRVAAAVDEEESDSNSFTPIAQSGIDFEEGGGPGCVMLSFSAEVLAPG